MIRLIEAETSLSQMRDRLLRKGCSVETINRAYRLYKAIEGEKKHGRIYVQNRA